MIGLEVLRSPVKWFAPVIAALLVYVAIAGMRPGLLLWSDVNASLTQASSLIDPLVAGIAAWEGGRRYRGGFTRRIDRGIRPGWSAVGGHLTAILFWFAVPALLAVAGFVIVFPMVGGYGAAEWPWLIAAASGAVLSAAFGYLVGSRAGGRWWAPPLAAIALYFGYVLIGGAHQLIPYWLVQAYPIVLNGSNPFVRYVTPTFWGQALWYLALSGVLVAFIPAAITRRSVRVVVVSVCLVAAIAGLTVLHSTRGQATTGYNSRDYVCDTSPVDICVNRAYRDGLPKLEQAFSTFNTKAADTPLAAPKLEQQVEGVGDDPSKGARALYVEDLGPTFASDSLLFYVQKYGGLERCSEAVSTNLHTIVDSWLIGQPSSLVTSPDAPEGAAAIRFSKLTDVERTAWLKANIDDVTACHLTPAQFP